MNYQQQQLLNYLADRVEHALARIAELEKQIQELKGNGNGRS